MAVVVEVEIGSKQALGSLNDLKAAATQLEDKLNNTEFGTAEFSRLSSQLKGVRSELKDFDLQLEGLDKEQRATALVDTFNGMVGAVGAVSSAFLAFGASTEAVDEVEKKLMGVIGIVQGLTEASNGFIAAQKLFGDTFTKIGETLAKTTLGQKALTAAQALGTVAMKAFNAVVKANPIGLLVTAILAAVAAIAYFVSSSDEATVSTDDLTKAMDRQREASDKNFDSLTKNQKNRIELLKAQGKSEREIFEQEQKDLTTSAKAKQKQFEDEEKNYKRLKKQLAKAREDDNEDEITKAKEALEVTRKRYKDAGTAVKNYYSEQKQNRKVFEAQEKTDAAKEAEAAAKEKAAKAKENAEKEREARKKALQEIADAERAFRLNDQQEAEFAVNQKYDALVASAKKYGKDTTTLEAARQDELKKIQDEADKEAKEKADKAIEEQKAKDKEILDAKLAREQAFIALSRELGDEQANNVLTALNEQIAAVEADSIAGVEKLQALKAQVIEQNRQKAIRDNEIAKQDRLIALNKQLEDFKGTEEEKLVFMQQYNDAAKAIQEQAANNAVTINASANAQILANDQETADQKKAINEATFNAIVSFADTTLNALGGLAEEGTKAQKAIEISKILISAATSAFQAFAQATATIPPPAGQIVGAALAAAIGAGAVKAIANVNSVQTGGGGGSTPSLSLPSGGTTTPPVMAGPDFGIGGSNQNLGVPTNTPTENLVKTYVLAGDVTSAQAAEAKLQQKRQL